MYNTLQKIKKKFNFLRNYFLIRPTIVVEPKSPTASLSDYFFYDCRDSKDTKINIINIFSQINPNKLLEDRIQIYIFDNKGNLLEELKFILKFNENREIIFSDLGINNFGSFFVFHSTTNYDELESKGSYPSERGYVGYRENCGIWNFVHGNRVCSYLQTDDIKSIMGYSFFETAYTPQVSFSDTRKFKLIFNNPLNFQIKLRVCSYDSENKILSLKNEKLNSYETKILVYDDVTVSYVKIYSKLIFCRPLIYKQYQKYFDIFHA